MLLPGQLKQAPLLESIKASGETKFEIQCSLRCYCESCSIKMKSLNLAAIEIANIDGKIYLHNDAILTYIPKFCACSCNLSNLDRSILNNNIIDPIKLLQHKACFMYGSFLEKLPIVEGSW